jgi:hypothetical protein
MMKWSMGIFCGLLGAYSSFKATEHMKNEVAGHPTDAKNHPQNALPLDEHAPKKTTHVNAVKHEGKLDSPSPHVALEK